MASAFGERRGEVLDAELGIAPEHDLRLHGAAELLGDDVEMDDALALRRHGEALGGDLAELAADDEDEVALLDQPVGDAVIAAEQAAESGLVQAMAPLPVMVWATGIEKVSAKRCSVAAAPDRCTPPPASTIGRLALARASAARASAAPSGRQRSAGAPPWAGSTRNRRR